MYQGKLILAGLATVMLMGCSQKSDTDAPVNTAGVAAVTSPEVTAPTAPMPAVEISASTRQHEVANSRPIDMPTLINQPVISTQTFEIGSDAPVAEFSESQQITAFQTRNAGAGPARFAPTYPERPVPQRGMKKQEVLAAVGKPANQMTGIGSEVWDYGTYRVFFSDEVVAFTRVW